MVITASVVSGVISDTAPTNVVLPTPNPPATTILTDIIGSSAGPPGPGCAAAISTVSPSSRGMLRGTGITCPPATGARCGRAA